MCICCVRTRGICVHTYTRIYSKDIRYKIIDTALAISCVKIKDIQYIYSEHKIIDSAVYCRSILPKHITTAYKHIVYTAPYTCVRWGAHAGYIPRTDFGAVDIQCDYSAVYDYSHCATILPSFSLSSNIQS